MISYKSRGVKCVKDPFEHFTHTGKAIINGNKYIISDGSSVIVPAGAKHNFINDGKTDLKLYSLYSPPHHKDGTIHKTKADAEADKEHFDSETTES